MAFTKLRYHISFATKRRQKLITSDIEHLLYEALRNSAVDAGGVLLAFGGDEHVHVVVAGPPTVALSDFVRKLKSGCSREVRRAFPDIGFRWQRSFAAFTVDAANMDRLLQYVCGQKQRHATGRLWKRFES